MMVSRGREGGGERTIGGLSSFFFLNGLFDVVSVHGFFRLRFAFLLFYLKRIISEIFPR